VLDPAGPAVPLDPPGTDDERKRRPWLWPLIVLGLLVVAAAVVGGIFLVNNGHSAPAATRSASRPATPSSTPSPTPSTTPTPTHPDRVTVNQSDYLGKNANAAQAALQQLGFTVNPVDGDPAPTAAQQDTVQSIGPTGNLPYGSTITLKVYQAVPTAPAPTSTPTASAVAPDGSFSASWSPYTGCPTGYAMGGYSYTITNGTDGAGKSSATTTDTSIQVRATKPGDVGVSYTVSCGTIKTTGSPTLTVSYQPAPSSPATEPAPAPSSSSSPGASGASQNERSTVLDDIAHRLHHHR
jgi:hypothetical protein